MGRVAWITGAAGLIGSYLLRAAPRFAAEWNVHGLTRAEVDLTNNTAVRELFARERPALIIHCAALSKTPVCQQNPSLAHKVNVEMTRQLTEMAAAIPLVFFSTDLVFDGRKGNYAETDGVNPISVYAETKATAERVVLANERHTVIRTSLNAGISPTGDRAFNEEMALAWKEGRTLELFTDEFRCPIAAAVTAQAVWELIAQNKPGLYHLAGSEKLSRWKIGKLLAARCSRFNPRIRPASLKDYQGAPRCPDTSLACSKIQPLLSFPVPGFSQWLAANPTEQF
jgi:dTDP-4-dehydrorhamnose reductase